MTRISFSARFVPCESVPATAFAERLARFFSQCAAPFLLDPTKIAPVVEPGRDGLYSRSLTKAFPKGVKGEWCFRSRQFLPATSMYDDYIRIEYPSRPYDFTQVVMPLIRRCVRSLGPYEIEVISSEIDAEATARHTFMSSDRRRCYFPPCGAIDVRHLDRVSAGLTEARLRELCLASDSMTEQIDSWCVWRPRASVAIESAPVLLAIPSEPATSPPASLSPCDQHDITPVFTEFAQAFIGTVVDEEDILLPAKLERSRLDGSPASLEVVDRYLAQVRRAVAKRLATDVDITILRTGAYLGEVIRRGLPRRSYRWIDYDDYVRANPAVVDALPERTITTCAMLVDADGGMLLPLNKVARYLDEGPEHSLHHFATATIADGSVKG